MGGVTIGQAEGCELVRGAVQIVDGGDFEREVVQARCVGAVQRQDVVIGSVGAKKHLAAVFIDGLQAPAIVVELGLIAQVLVRGSQRGRAL